MSFETPLLARRNHKHITLQQGSTPYGIYFQSEIRYGNSERARHTPKSTLGFVYTFIPANRDLHDPVVQVTTDQFTNDDSDLRNVLSEAELGKKFEKRMTHDRRAI